MKNLVFSIIILCLILGVSCSKVKEDDLEPSIALSTVATTQPISFYLLKSYKLLPNQCAVDLKSVVLADQPLLTSNDVISYNDKTYTYSVSTHGYAAVRALKDATPIAICLGKKIIFTSIYKPLTSSSTCYQSITAQAMRNNEIKFQLGYPSLPTGVKIDDQRNNSELIETLRAYSKLNVAFACINIATEQSLLVADVKQRIYGEWKLQAVWANVANPPVPEVKVVFKDVLGAPIDKQVADVYLNCKLAYTTTYNLKQINGTIKSVRLEPDKKTYMANEPAVLGGTVKICEGELMIDTGMAFDASAYLFRKINTANCLLKPDAGFCLAAFKRYYYDPAEKKCKEFMWGGCEGVVPFETLEACKDCECNK
jgi:Kunitz/Bovine pancreatic trypsin inhibitor domain